jgi:hypothetical protein
MCPQQAGLRPPLVTELLLSLQSRPVPLISAVQLAPIHFRDDLHARRETEALAA